MNKSKKKLITAIIALACLLIVVLGSIAYFTAEEKTRNIITTGGVAIEVVEFADEDMTTPFPENGVTGVMPGTSVTKIVQVKNTGASPAWVRIKVEKVFNLAEGVEGTPDSSLIAIDIDPAGWTEKDGWYYYSEALKPGETTTPLFKHVTFDVSMQNMYQNSTAEVNVTSEAVQVANNGASALDAAGWPDGAATGTDSGTAAPAEGGTANGN